MGLYSDGICVGANFNQLTAIRPDIPQEGHSCWVFACSCGTMGVYRAEAVRRGNNVCCGKVACLDKHRRDRCEDPVKGARNYVLRYYKASAKLRNYEFSLSDPQCLALFAEPCFYCGVAPSTVSRPRRTRSPFIYNGIDRVNNEKGYTPENCVPCCKTCNIMKQALSEVDFIRHIRRINLWFNEKQSLKQLTPVRIQQDQASSDGITPERLTSALQEVCELCAPQAR